MKIIRCHDLGFACDQAILAESEEEALNLAAEHAQTVHGVQVTPEVTAQVQTYIQDLSDEELDQIVGGSSTPNGGLNISGGTLNIYPPSGGTVNIFINED